MKPLLLDYNLVVCLNRILVWHPTSHMYINIPTHIHTHIHTYIHTCLHAYIGHCVSFLSTGVWTSAQEGNKHFLLYDIFLLLRKPGACESFCFLLLSLANHLSFPFITNRGGVGPFVTARVWFCYSLPFSDPSSNYKPSDPKASAVRTHGVSIFSPGGALSRSNLTWCLQDH